MTNNSGEQEIWIIYKASSTKTPGWKERVLMPDGGLTDIIREAFDYSGGKNQPCVGDRIPQFKDGHWRESDWIISQVKHFTSPDSEEKIIVCHCDYSPITVEWKEVRRVDTPTPPLR